LIWASCDPPGELIKIDPSNGDVIQRQVASFTPGAITANEEFLFAASPFLSGVNLVSPSSGTVVGAIQAQEPISGLAFDGTHLWGLGSQSGQVIKFSVEHRQQLFSITRCSPCDGIVYDGKNIVVIGNLKMFKLETVLGLIVEESDWFAGVSIGFDGETFRGGYTPAVSDGDSYWTFGNGEARGSLIRTKL